MGEHLLDKMEIETAKLRLHKVWTRVPGYELLRVSSAESF